MLQEEWTFKLSWTTLNGSSDLPELESNDNSTWSPQPTLAKDYAITEENGNWYVIMIENKYMN